MRTFLVILSTACLLLVFSFVMRFSTVTRLDAGWEYAPLPANGLVESIQKGEWHPIAHAATVRSEGVGRPLVFRVTVPAVASMKEPQIFFQWVQDAFSVYVGTHEVFRTSDFASPEVERTLRRWWMVPLPQLRGGEILSVVVRPAVNSFPSIAGLPLLGDRYEIVRSIFVEETYKIFVGSLSLFFGVLILIFFGGLRRADRAWLVLATASIFFGVWVIASAATRVRLFFYDNQQFWLYLDHYSLCIYGVLLVRCYSLMASVGPFRICLHYGRMALAAAALLMLAVPLGLLPILDLLPLAQVIVMVGAGIAMIDSIWLALQKKTSLFIIALGLVLFGVCGLHDTLMDIGVIRWAPQLTPFSGFVLVLVMGSVIANNYWRTQENLVVAEQQAETEHLRALQLETETKLNQARYEGQLQRSQQEERIRSLNAMLSLADRFNNPVTGILNHVELLLRRLKNMRELPEDAEAQKHELSLMEKGLLHVKSSVDELRLLSGELARYRESAHEIHAGDMSLERNILP